MLTYDITAAPAPYLSAVGDGETDDTQAFTDFKTWALANQGDPAEAITLLLPAGKNFYIAANLSGPNGAFAGIKDLIISGYDGTITMGSLFPNGFFIPINAFTQNTNTKDALIETVDAGAQSVTLLTPAQYIIFPAGQWCMLSGICTQIESGPPNPAFFEFLQVQSVNSDTGVVTFTTPLQYSYKQTWPLYFAGDAIRYSSGGPATLYALDPDWDANFVMEGVTIDGGSATYIAAKNVTLTDVSFTGNPQGGLAPHTALNYTLNNVSHLSGMEMDKCIDTLTINGGNYGGLIIASACLANQMNVDGSTIDFLNGTAKNSLFTNCTINNVSLGSAFGKTDSILFDGCDIGVSSNQNQINYTGQATESYVDTNYTLTSSEQGAVLSVLTSWVLNSQILSGIPYPLRWAVPGAQCVFSVANGGTYTEGYPFQILDCWQDATKTYIQTNLQVSSWEEIDLPRDPTSGLTLLVHPCPDFTVRNCTGGYQTTTLNDIPAHTPFGQLNRRIFHASELPVYSGETVYYPNNVFGKIKSIIINVVAAYSGAHDPLLLDLSAFGLGVPIINLDTGADTRYSIAINLRQTGTRTIAVGNITGSQSGDTIPTLGNFWLKKGYSPTLQYDISGEGSNVEVTITVETDQGIPLIEGMRLEDEILDSGLTLLNTTATKIHLCSAVPEDYVAIGTLTLGNKTWSAGSAIGAIAAHIPNGRQVATTAFVDGVVTGDGTATHVAITTGSALYAVAELTSPITVAVGIANLFALPSFLIAVPSVGTGVTLGPNTIDLGLNALSLANKIIICSDVPTTYAGAVTSKIGEKDFGIGGCFDSITDHADGRKIASVEVSGGDGLVPDTPASWAVIDEANSRLLAVGNLSGATMVTADSVWTLDSFTIYLPGVGT